MRIGAGRPGESGVAAVGRGDGVAARLQGAGGHLGGAARVDSRRQGAAAGTGEGESYRAGRRARSRQNRNDAGSEGDRLAEGRRVGRGRPWSSSRPGGRSGCRCRSSRQSQCPRCRAR